MVQLPWPDCRRLERGIYGLADDVGLRQYEFAVRRRELFLLTVGVIHS